MERQNKGIWIPIEIWEDKNLTWNEKILFLEIDSFTTKEKDCYISNEYIAKLLGVTETSANKILSSLISKGYVVKTKFDGRRRFIKTNLSYNKLDLTYETSQPCRSQQPCLAADSNILIQYTNTNYHIKEEKDKSFSKKDDFSPLTETKLQEYNDIPKKKRNTTSKDDPLFEECWKEYNRKGSKCKSKVYWNKLTDKEKQKVLPHIKAYTQSRERVYQSDFERYLRDKKFNDVVYKGNIALYDPEMYDDKQTYRPYVEYPYLWQREEDGKYYFTGNIINLADGYTKDNRPNGAQVHQNGYTYTWNSETKKWDVK